MKLLQKAAISLLAAAIAMSMLTACSSSGTPSAPSTPSNPGTSQGGTENPGEDNNTPGGDSGDPDENPDDTPSVAPGWSTSLAKAYLNRVGVTTEDYHLYNEHSAASVIYYSNGESVDGDDDYSVDLAVEGSKRLVSLTYALDTLTGFYTDGQNYYATEDIGDWNNPIDVWRKVTYQGTDPFGEYLGTGDAKMWIDMFGALVPIPKESEIKGFESVTEDGITTETVTMENGVVYTYEFNAVGELKKIDSRVVITVQGQSGGVSLTMADPTFAKASTSKPFPTDFDDKPYGWTEDQGKDEDGNALPTSWADSRIKAYLTRSNITKNDFFVLAQYHFSDKMVAYQIQGDQKMLQIGTGSGYEALYSYADGVYTKYTEADESTGRVLTDAQEIATAKSYFDSVEAIAKIPSDAEVTAFRANSEYSEKFITADGTMYLVGMDGNGGIQSVQVQTTDGNYWNFSIKQFRGNSATSTSVLSSLVSMLTSLF